MTRTESLANKLFSICTSSNVEGSSREVAQIAYAQASLTACAVQTLRNVLVQKGILNDTEFDNLLADEYESLLAKLTRPTFVIPSKVA